jgi:hypothetical protein
LGKPARKLARSRSVVGIGGGYETLRAVGYPAGNVLDR